MAGAGVSPVAGSGSSGAVQAYLAVLADGLTGPKPVRAAIVDEIEDGLHEAVAAHLEQGLSPSRAEEAAFAEFGEPLAVAAGFRSELAAASARRVGRRLLATGPLVGLTWLGAVMAGALWGGVPPPPGWGRAATLFAVVLVVAVPAAVLAVAATGPLSRWLPAAPRVGLTAATTAAAACVLGDVGLLTWLVASPLVEGAGMAWPLALPAVASLTRLALAGLATQRCLAARALLP
jgi:hypothetical protein